LDIKNGVYVGGDDETIFATSNPFTLYALNQGAGGGTFYVSMALVPKLAPPGGDFGSFKYALDSDNSGTVNGSESWQTVLVSGDMTYGTAPLELLSSIQGWDAGDLAKHGIFETYFIEVGFSFNDALKTTPYNSADGSTTGLTADPSGTMLFMPFLLDLSGLDLDYALHFDLYNTQTKTLVENLGKGQKVELTDVDVNGFAPFSHDAQSGNRVPDGGTTLLLLGVALAGLSTFTRKTA
jgi:hypothetical protein